MRLLALDIGSSSVKAALLHDSACPRTITRVAFETIYDADGSTPRAEVKPAAIAAAIHSAIAMVGAGARRVDLIAATTMSPSWLALDAKGRPLTNVITHQDRRSVHEAALIETRVGKARHLKLAGNRPFPGGISSTTWAWHVAHARSILKRAAVVGHLGTWLAHEWTGARVIDLSNAGFTGLMDVARCAWSDELIEAVGVDRAQLPRIVASDEIVGHITPAAARRFGLTAGTPMLAGCVDGSAAMLAGGAAAGQLVNVCGSTDVLALCTSAPHPHADLLTRPLGVDGKWLSVATIAAAGSAVEWVGRTFFSEMQADAFHRHVMKVGAPLSDPVHRVRFTPALAGSRTSMHIEAAMVEGLSLATTRDEILRSLLGALRELSGARIERFASLKLPMKRDVVSTGGGSKLATKILRSQWPKRFRYRQANEATLRGLQTLAGRTR